MTVTLFTSYAHRVIKLPHLLDKPLPRDVKFLHAILMTYGGIYHSAVGLGTAIFVGIMGRLFWKYLPATFSIPCIAGCLANIIAFAPARRKQTIKAIRCFQMIFVGFTARTCKEVIAKLVKFNLLESDRKQFCTTEWNERKWEIRFATGEESVVAQKFVEKFPLNTRYNLKDKFVKKHPEIIYQLLIREFKKDKSELLETIFRHIFPVKLSQGGFIPCWHKEQNLDSVIERMLNSEASIQQRFIKIIATYYLLHERFDDSVQSEDKDSLLDCISKLCTECKSISIVGLTTLTTGLLKIDLSEREKIINVAVPLLKMLKLSYGSIQGNHVLIILNAIHLTPPEERDQLIQTAQQASQRVEQKKHTTAILCTWLLLPKPIISDIDKVVPLFQDIDNLYNENMIISKFEKIPVNDRLSFIINAYPYLKTTKNHSLKIAIFDLCLSNKWNLLPPTSERSDEKIAQAILLKLLREKQHDFAENDVKNCFLFPNNPLWLPSIIRCFETLGELDSLYITDVSIRCIYFDHNSYDIRQTIIAFIKKDYESLCRHIHISLNQDDITEYTLNVVKEILKDPTLFNLFVKYLDDGIGSSETSKKDRNDIAKIIFNYYEYVHLDDEHALMQSAVTLLFKDNAINNPYRVFDRLKTTLESEPLVTGNEYQWDLAKLRETAWPGYTVKDLPLGVTATTLDDLFNSLKARLEDISKSQEGDSKETRKKRQARLKTVEDYIYSCSGYNVDLHIFNMHVPYINNLLLLGPKPDDPITPDQFQFFMCLKSLLDLDNTVPEGQLLSEREEKLIKMSASIGGCLTGREDSVANFYKSLPAKYKLGPIPEGRAELKRAQEFINQQVQPFLQSIFESNELLRELFGREITQGSHHIKYLKNRFHEQVGYRHKFKFDVGTHTLLSETFQITTSRFLSVFFKHASVEKFCQHLVVVSEEAFKNDLYGSISKLIEVGAPKPIDFTKYIEFDDDCKPVKLTALGAHVLLKGNKLV